MAVVAVLLGIFLGIRLGRKEPKIKFRSPVTVEPLPVPKDTKVEQKLAAVKKALENHEYEEALKMLSEMGDFQTMPEFVTLEAQVKTALEHQQSEKRQKRHAELLLMLQEAEKLHGENRYGEALTLLKKARQNFTEFPDLIDPKIERTEEVQREAGTAAEEKVRQARELLARKNFLEALRMAETALTLVPERADLRNFVEEIRERQKLETMVFIMESETTLGDDAQEDEKPRRTVQVMSFYMDRCEVTNQEYNAFCRATGHEPPPSWPATAEGRIGVPAGLGNHPVVGVTAADAEAYAAWAGKRLPTEVEWEKAARWIDGRSFPWGNAFKDSELEFRCNSYEYGMTRVGPGGRPPHFGTIAIGALPQGASPYGVQDMAGNVWEWTSTTVAQEGVSRRVVKGGSFATTKEAVRCSNRLLEDPELGHHDLGFRCAMDAVKTNGK